MKKVTFFHLILLASVLYYKKVRVMGILVALIGVAIIAAVVVASFTAVLGGVIGGELEDEEE